MIRIFLFLATGLNFFSCFSSRDQLNNGYCSWSADDSEILFRMGCMSAQSKDSISRTLQKVKIHQKICNYPALIGSAMIKA